MHIAGAVLLMLCPMLIGFKYSMNMAASKRELGAVLQLIDWMSAEIHYQKDELAQTLRRAAGMEIFEQLNFLKTCAELLNENPFPVAWKSAVEESALRLSKDDKNLLSSLGNILGATDADEQIRMLGHIRQQFDNRFKESQQLYATKGKMVRSLGVLIGLAVGVIIV